MPNLTSTLKLSLIDDVTKNAQTVTDALKKSESQIKAIDAAFKGTGASARFQQQLSSLGRSAAEVDKVANAMREYASAAGAAGNAANWTREQSAQMRRWETQTIAALKNVSAQEKVFERQQSAVGGAQQRRFLKHGPGGVRAGHGFGPGVGGMIVGGGIAHQLWEGAKSGADIQSEIAKNNAIKMPAEETDQVGKAAVDIAARVPTAKIPEIMKDYRDLRSVLTHREHAMEMLEEAERARAAMNAIDRTGGMAEGLPFAFKGAEIMGKANTREEFRKYLDNFVRAQQVVGKTITPEQQMEFAKYAHSAGPQLSDRFISGAAISLGQEVSGSTAGKMISQFEKQTQGGLQNQHAVAKEWLRLGLVNPEDVDYLKNGEIKGLKAGKHIVDYKLAQTDPDQWYYKNVLPRMEKLGITDRNDQASENMRLTGNQNVADLLTKFLTQRQAFENHAKMYSEAQGLNAVESNQKDPYVAMNAFSAAVSNFAGTMSSPGIARAGEVLSELGKDISSFTSRLSNWQKKNPEEAKAASSAGLYGAVATLGRGAYGLGSRFLGWGAGAAGEGAGLIGTALSLPVTAGVMSGIYANEKYRGPEADARWEDTKRKFAEYDAAHGSGGSAAGSSAPSPAPYYDQQMLDLREAAKPPAWAVNQPQKSWPMTGAGGATAGVEGPEYPNLTGGVDQIGAALQNGAGQASAAGASTAQAYHEAFIGQLQQTLSEAQSIIQQLIGTLDFSASPRISPTGDAGTSAPRRTSSLQYDMRRASGAETSHLT